MKKLVLLLSLALLSACGGSSSTTTTARTQPTDTAQAAADQNGTGTVSFNVASAAAKRGATVTTPTTTADFGRIVITNDSLNDTASGRAFQIVKDFNFASGPQMPNTILPVANGYTVEIIRYAKNKPNFRTYSTARDYYATRFGFFGYSSATSTSTFRGYTTSARNWSGTPNGAGTMTEYVVATFDMTSGGPVNLNIGTLAGTTITLTTAGITAPTTNFASCEAIFGNATSGKSFKVTANLNSATSPLATDYWGLKFGFTAAAANAANATMFTTLQTGLLYGPYSIATADYYASAVFYPKKSLLKPTETRESFVYQLKAVDGSTGKGSVTVTGGSVTF